MNTTSELTIVIPAKNEAKLIPRLLTSLTNQDYSKMSSTRVLVADANSTDGTPEIVLGFRDRLNVSVIRGGMPSVGRNLGAAQADSTYVLFLDADIELAHPSVVRRAVELAQRKQLHCVTTNILCRDGSWIDKLFYAGNDFFQYLSRLHHPFATGMFMLFELKQFRETSRISRASGSSPKIICSASRWSANVLASSAAASTRLTADSRRWDICAWDGCS